MQKKDNISTVILFLFIVMVLILVGLVVGLGLMAFILNVCNSIFLQF